MESHYTRKASKKQYLPHDLNIKKMWILYCEKCKGLGHTPVKENMYRKVFCEHFNLSFFKPKKDQCSLCTLYERRKSGDNLSTAFMEQYKQHQLDKTQARDENLQISTERKQTKAFMWLLSTCKQCLPHHVHWCPSCIIHESYAVTILQFIHLEIKMFSAMCGMKLKESEDLQKSQHAY